MRDKSALHHYLLDLDQFDADHLHVLELVRAFSCVHCNSAALTDLVESIHAACAAHIQAEEFFMGQTGFPFLLPHRADHVRIGAKISDLLEKGSKYQGRVLLTYLASEIEDLLLAHADTYDRQYSTFLHSK